MPTPTVTLVTSRNLPTLTEDLAGLADEVAARGVEVRVSVWDDPDVNWSDAGLCVILSVSDFADRPEEFFAWAEKVPRILNDPGVLRWNTDKHYLRELEGRGLPTIQTTWLEPSAGLSKHQVHTRMPALGDFVVKSSLSSGRHTTGRYTAIDARSRGAAIHHALQIMEGGRAALVQHYLSAVGNRGEISLVFFNGLLSHAVEKEGILQTEIDPGDGPRSRAFPHAVTAEERHLGEDVRNALHACIREVTGRDHLLLYTRVDMIHTGDGLKLLEVNLMDVTLYLTIVPGALDRFADAISVRAFW